MSVIAFVLVTASCSGAGTQNLQKNEIAFENEINIQIDLPEDFEVIPNPYDTNRLPTVVNFPQQSFGIERDGILIGSMTLVDRRSDTYGEGEDAWIQGVLESNDRPWNIYQELLIALINDDWEQGYASVYESDDRMEGSAVSYVGYRSDIMDRGWYGDWEPDLSHCAKDKPVNATDSRFYYFNRAVMGYNLNLKYWAAMELNYDCITDQEHQRIAQSLRIVSGGAE